MWSIYRPRLGGFSWKIKMLGMLLPLTVSAAALAQNQSNLSFVVGSYNVQYTMAVGDIYSKGVVEPLGTVNDGFGTLNLLSTDPQRFGVPPGLESLTAPGRANRDTRLADFDNDGFLDVVSNTYSCVD